MEQSEIKNSYLMAADTTTYYADTVEWCPFKDFSHLFACGTYQLDEELSSNSDSQIRLGNVTLYKLTSSDNCSAPSFNISIEDCVPTSGILSMKWNSCILHNKIILALVCSNGKVLLKFFNDEKERIHLSHLTDYDLAGTEKNMVLSIDWSTQNENSTSMITSDTKGHLNYIHVGEAEMHLVNSWKAHDFESWIAAFNCADKNIVYSGGDDSKFKAWDVRNLQSPIFSKKNHSMGVTAITNNKLDENVLVTGSYDENIFLWDIRQMKTHLSDIHIGGGIWRLKWHPSNRHYLLSAAMHNGFHILSVKDNLMKLETSYTQHKSLAYGADWSYLTSEISSNRQNSELLCDLHKSNIKNIVASCSFYDNLLHVWGVNF